MLYHDRHERTPLELAQESYPVAMFGRDAPRRSARLSPPGAGAPSGASVAKGDIAPIAKEPDYRTPGKSLAKRAPWKSPGAALRDRDRENNYVSARKKSVRKLSARSPATAAMASGAARNGRPRFTPAEMKTPSATPSKKVPRQARAVEVPWRGASRPRPREQLRQREEEVREEAIGQEPRDGGDGERRRAQRQAQIHPG